MGSDGEAEVEQLWEELVALERHEEYLKGELETQERKTREIEADKGIIGWARRAGGYIFGIYCGYRIVTNFVALWVGWGGQKGKIQGIAGIAGMGAEEGARGGQEKMRGAVGVEGGCRMSSLDPIHGRLGGYMTRWNPNLNCDAWIQQIAFLGSGGILLASIHGILDIFHKVGQRP